MAIMRRFALPSLGIALLLGAIYGRAVLWNEFVTWDDGLLITKNPIVQEFSFRSIGKAFTSYDPELYIPLIFLSYQMDHLVWGLNPVGFHLTNLMLHILNAILVFWLMTLLIGSCHTKLRVTLSSSKCDTQVPWFDGLTMTHSWIPLLVALLFAIHPLNTEAVVWASARKDLLSGFFFLLTLCTYLKWRGGRVTLSSSKGDTQVPWFDELTMTHCLPRTWYWLSLIAFLLGLLAKVSIIMTPFVLLLLEWFHSSHPLPFKGEGRVRVLRSLLPFFALSLIFGIIATFGKTGNTELFSEKILIGAKAAVFYLEKLLWPAGLSVLYPYTKQITWSSPDLFLPLAVLLFLSALAFFLRKKYPVITYGWFFFLLMLLPSFTNFAKGHDQLRDVYFASDRYAYLPSIGIFFLLISFIYSVLPTSHFLLPTLLALPLAFLSFHQSTVWRTTETLFQNVSQQYPDSHIAWNNLGSLALKRGDAQTAVEHYERSLAIRPNAAAFFNMGQIALQKGLLREAMELYRRAILSRPNDTDALLNLGVLYLRTGDAHAAADLFRRAIAFDDRLPIAHFNLGLALEALKDDDGARAAFTHVLAIDPNDQEAREKLARLKMTSSPNGRGPR